jgi:hypothetical protein
MTAAQAVQRERAATNEKLTAALAIGVRTGAESGIVAGRSERPTRGAGGHG